MKEIKNFAFVIKRLLVVIFYKLNCMEIKDFKNIEYLKQGNSRQKLVYLEIIQLNLFEKLKTYKPILTGTIPIEIDLPTSDLDIICECENHDEFSRFLIEQFGNKKDFKISTTILDGEKSTIAEFKTKNFTFELFGQNIPVENQNAYKHMIVEYNILKEKGEAFKQEIKRLKARGMKTEPAFAKLLKLEGNPFDELLKRNDSKIYK